MMLALGLVGVPIAAAVSRAIIPLGPGSWRWVFVIGAAGALGAAVALRVLPESPRWQAAHSKGEQADWTVSKLEAEARAATGEELPTPVAEETTVTHGRVRDLITTGYGKRTLVASLLMIFAILGFYGFNSWIPTLLAERGYTVSQSLTYTLVLSVAAVPGALLAWPMVDRWERKNLLVLVATSIALLMIVFGLVPGIIGILIIGFVITLLLQTSIAIIYTYLPEIFPTQLRGLGSGTANSMGRLAGVAGSFIVAAVFSGIGFVAVFIYLAVAEIFMGCVVGVFGQKTTRRPVEEYTPHAKKSRPQGQAATWSPVSEESGGDEGPANSGGSEEP